MPMSIKSASTIKITRKHCTNFLTHKNNKYTSIAILLKMSLQYLNLRKGENVILFLLVIFNGSSYKTLLKFLFLI